MPNWDLEVAPVLATLVASVCIERMVIIVFVLTLGALVFQIWTKYDERKNPDTYSLDWKSVLEEE